MRLKTNSLKRTVAVLAAVCTLGTCCVAGSVAWAEPEQKGANTADISSTCGLAGNNTKCTSITIHKYNSPSLTELKYKPNGTDMSEAIKAEGVNKPLKGVEFTLYKIQKNNKDIDLSSTTGWDDIKDLFKSLANGRAATVLSGNTALTKVKVGEAKETDENGVVKFDNLDESLYYVEETSTAHAQKDYATEANKHDWQPITVTVKTDPFFVTTPLSHKTDDSWEWLYDVHVFPKNDVNKETPTKTAADPNKYYVDEKGGTVIPWNISIPLSAPSKGKKYEKIGFVDSLPKGLRYLGVADVMLVKVQKKPDEGKKPTSEDIKLSPKEDTQKGTKKEYDATEANGKVTFSLTADGLAKIDDIDNYTYTLKVTLNTGVTKGTKNFTNFITGWIDDSKIGDGDENNPCVPTEQNPCDSNPHGSSHFATLKITKVAINAKKKKDEQLTNKTLKGAKFAVYVMKDQSAALTGVTTDKLDKVMKDSNTQLTMVTGEDGTASVDLFIGNDKKTTSRKYCLVETDAPAGFKKDPTPHCYNVEEETDQNVTAEKPVADANSQKIGNDQATELDKILGALPMTGARGLVLLTAFGIVGLGGTMFYIITRRRKEQEEA